MNSVENNLKRSDKLVIQGEVEKDFSLLYISN